MRSSSDTARFFEPAYRRVPRFRSSHHFAARSFANFGIEGHYQLIDLVWLWFRSPHLGLAARAMRTSEPPHSGEVIVAQSTPIGFVVDDDISFPEAPEALIS